MVINSDNIVLGGNMRLKAIAELGMKEIPDSWVKKATDLTEEEARRFIIADNVGFGEHDWEVLANEWNMDELTDWGLEIPDFVNKAEATEDDYTIPDEIKTDIIKGDLFELTANGITHRLLCGDSTNADDVAKLMDGEKADMVFTDPPYGVDYSGGLQFKDGVAKKEQRKRLQNDESDSIYALVVPLIAENCNGAVYMWFAGTKAKNMYEAVEQHGDIHALIIWVKNGGYGALNANYKQKHEPCLYWKPKGKKLNFCGATTETTIWNIDKDGINKMHPTQKPVALAHKAISNHSVGLVADFFGGSGSTLVAAAQLNRRCFIQELDEKYCQVIIDRFTKLYPETEIKRNGVLYVKTGEKQVSDAIS